MLRFHPAFSLLKIFNRGMAMLAADGLRLVVSAIVCLAIPYALLNYWLLKPFYDGTLHVKSVWDPEYLWRMGLFYLIYFCIRGLNYVMTGQLLFDQGLNRRQTLSEIVPSGLIKLSRAIWLLLSANVLAQAGYFAYMVPGFLLGYVIDFTLPGFTLEKKKLSVSWREGFGYLKGQYVATLCNFALLCLASIAIQKATKWLMSPALISENFVFFALASGLAAAAMELFLQAWMTSLYFTARNLSRTTPEGIAQIFD